MQLWPRVCGRDGCENIFVPKAHNGLFCTAECRKISTNAKVLKRYYDGQKIRNGTIKRNCKTENCITVLSRYNKEGICEQCKIKKLKKRLSGWGWSPSQIEKKVDSMEF